MKFDGKQMRAATVDVVKAPKTANKAVGPIIIVVILVIALLGVVAYIFMSGVLNPKTLDISFTKPDGWKDDVYVYVVDGENKNAAYPGEKMQKGTGNTYTYKVSENLKNGKLVFNDGANSHRYPLEDKDALTIEDKKTYSTSSTNSSTSSTASKASTASK